MNLPSALIVRSLTLACVTAFLTTGCDKAPEAPLTPPATTSIGIAG